jgi:hypothetical protein
MLDFLAGHAEQVQGAARDESNRYLAGMVVEEID